MGGVLKREVFILTKFICFRPEYQEFKNSKYPVHELTRLGHLEIHITCSNLHLKTGGGGRAYLRGRA